MSWPHLSDCKIRTLIVAISFPSICLTEVHTYAKKAIYKDVHFSHSIIIKT